MKGIDHMINDLHRAYKKYEEDGTIWIMTTVLILKRFSIKLVIIVLHPTQRTR